MVKILFVRPGGTLQKPASPKVIEVEQNKMGKMLRKYEYVSISPQHMAWLEMPPEGMHPSDLQSNPMCQQLGGLLEGVYGKVYITQFDPVSGVDVDVDADLIERLPAMLVIDAKRRKEFVMDIICGSTQLPE